ncbi:tRNA ligase [Ceratobasidium sp. AG-Ba]|nr:tRNA ligase [Ceratobasidium sp. AG-Ba]
MATNNTSTHIDVDEVKIDTLEISNRSSIPPTQPDDSDLIRELRALAKNQPKLVRGKKYDVPGQKFQLTSWKMTEHMYTRSPCPFPTLARGLFTRWVPNPGREDEPEGTRGAGRDLIVVRGYDKFFNMNEWEALAVHTRPPYVLTLKSNGCIIFMSALSSTEIVVTSKHSLGEVVGSTTSHAEKGEEWLDKHLKRAGRTKAEFAKELFDRNITAVAELCDDSFEEHVLPYSKEMTGLHLHGLNERRGDFCTLPNDQVDSFARKWGFIPTATVVFNKLHEVQSFTSEVGETGKWRGEAVEGFVVRTTISDREPQLVQAYRGTRGERDTDKMELSTPPPYSPGSTFFFKINAAEKGQLDGCKLSSFILRRPETRAYVHWAEDQIRKNKKSFEGFSTGHGIIAARERFFEWCKTTEGRETLEKENAEAPKHTGDAYTGPHKTVIMPVAIPGRKTAVAIALKHLFDFGHTQSDDVKQKKTGPQFVKNVMDLLKKNDVVFADRNNHTKHLRDAVRHDLKERYGSKGHIIVLNWLFNHTPQRISDICAARILARGDNHQTLHPDDQDSHRGVISMFFGSFEDVEPDEADDVIDMEYDETLDRSVKRAVEGLCSILNLDPPSEEQMEEACQVALAYEVKSTGKKPPAPKAPRYYAFVPSLPLENMIREKINSQGVPESAQKLWNIILENHRLPENPHVTLVHTKEKQEANLLWDHCTALRKTVPESQPSFRVTFDHLVWNANVMALSASNLEMHTEVDGDYGEIGKALIEDMPENIKGRLHLTIGTREDSINPFEAAGMVEGWRKGEDNGAQSISLDRCIIEGKIMGRYS